MIPDIDYGSVTWERYRIWLADELFEIYKRLASTSLSMDQIRVLQGKASAYTQMLELGDSKAAFKPLDKRG